MTSYIKVIFLCIVFLVPFGISYCDVLNLVSKKISFYLDDSYGAFYVENPNPLSKNLRELLFKDNPPTSYITLYVNDKPYRLNENGKISIIRPFMQEDNVIECDLEIDKVLFDLIFMITNLADKPSDSIICLVDMKNDGNPAVTAGVRFLFDTVYGEDENKPVLYLSGGDKIEYDRMFGNENMPQFIFSGTFDWDSQTFGKGLYIYPYINEIKPGKVIIGNWKKLNEREISYVINPPARFKYYMFSKPDAAVAVYYNNIKLKGGEESSYGVILSVMKIPKISIKSARFNEENKTVSAPVTNSEKVITGQSMSVNAELQKPSLKEEIGVLEKLNGLIDRLDSLFSNGLQPLTNKAQGSDLEKGLEKSAPESMYGEPFSGSASSVQPVITNLPAAGYSSSPVSQTTNNPVNEENTAMLKSDAARLQKQYDDKIAGLKAYYEDLIKKQEKEYKEISSSYKEYSENRENKNNRSKKMEEVNNTITQIDKKISIIEELLQLNLDFETMPREKIEEIQKKIGKIEEKLK